MIYMNNMAAIIINYMSNIGRKLYLQQLCVHWQCLQSAAVSLSTVSGQAANKPAEQNRIESTHSELSLTQYDALKAEVCEESLLEYISVSLRTFSQVE
jgi:hypothetical protein